MGDYGMATIERYEDIQGWQRARELTKFIYAITKQEAFARDFSLKDQIRRAAVSVMSNIAEGFERGGRAEFIQFLSIAKSSAAEVQSQLYVALDQEYIMPEQLTTGHFCQACRFLPWRAHIGHQVCHSEE
jgi:four helix bundle protein